MHASSHTTGVEGNGVEGPETALGTLAPPPPPGITPPPGRGSHRFPDCPCTGSSSDAESGVLPITSQFHFNQYVVTMRVLIDHNFKYYQQGLWVRTDTEAHGCAPAQNPIARITQSCIYVYIHACIQPYNRSRRKRSRRAGNCTGHLCTTVLS